MTKTVTEREAQSDFESLAAWVEADQNAVVVERDGKPTIAIIPADEFNELADLRKAKIRQQALTAVRALREETLALNGDLSDTEVQSIADALILQALKGIE